MTRYLVVANRTLGGDELLAVLERKLAAAPGAIHVLVPATPDPAGWVSDDHSDRALATQRLEAALERFAELGTEVTGEVGDARPVDAVLDVLRRDGERIDEIVLSTLPPGASRWLGMDPVSRIERAVAVPVTHVLSSERLPS